jgi:hypothetical protein
MDKNNKIKKQVQNSFSSKLSEPNTLKLGFLFTEQGFRLSFDLLVNSKSLIYHA